jgi:uncharacterized membrane protein YphA (DoxX/SURF4 family)
MTVDDQALPSAKFARVQAVDSRLRDAVVASARIACGLLWLANLHWKVPPNFGEDTGGGLYKYTVSAVNNPVWGVWKWLTKEIILPNFHVFGWMVIIVDGTLAALLLIGYRTRLAALVGAFNAIPIFLSVIYYDKSYEWPWSYALIFFLHLMLYAVPPGDHAPRIDTVLRGDRAARDRAFVVLGAVAVLVGAIGWYLARDLDFATTRVAMLGHAKWELKLLWFNGLSALLTIVFGIGLIVGARQRFVALAASLGFGVLAVVALAQQHWNNVSAGPPPLVGTGSNAAFWAMFLVAGAVMFRADRRGA